MCTTSKLRKHTAAQHLLGSLNLSLAPGQKTDVTNTCKVSSELGDVHVMNTTPHMHKLGTHMKTTVERADHTVETLSDVPFDFNDQAFYPSDMVIHQGDVLTTTCSYENTTDQTVGWGEGSDNEMCFNFVLAWPAGSLSGNGLRDYCLGGLIPGF